MKRFGRRTGVRVLFPQAAMNSIFDECDRFDQDETGGRIVGNYTERQGELVIEVTAMIGPGPEARRSSVSFFQDGDYQERVFRTIEERHPKVEHLGNWHTHHVNGLPRLSSGDVATYKRTVNHRNHNTSFFYAVLVVAKNENATRERRYSVKHYLLRRRDDEVHEIPPSNIELVDRPLIWTILHETTPPLAQWSDPPSVARPDRVYDRDIFADCFPELRPYTSPKLGMYWRGPIALIDGSNLEVVVSERESESGTTHSIVVRSPPSPIRSVTEHISERDFSSARAAVIATERACNHALYASVLEASKAHVGKRKG